METDKCTKGQIAKMEFEHALEHIDEDMVILQANIDDMNPEHTTYVSDRLFENGANDVYWIPIIMKKGRPGLMLNVLVHKEQLEQMKQIVFTETTTLGLRYWSAACHRLGRKRVPVDTPWGKIHVKVGTFQGGEVQIAPEFRECEAAARTHRIPLKDVYAFVMRAYSG